MVILGTVLRIVSALWIIAMLPRIFTGMTGVTSKGGIVIALVSVAIAVVVFKFGSRLKERASESSGS